MQSELLTKTIELLNKDKGNWPETAKETGLGREWLAKLSAGLIGDPGVNKIEVLHEYLNKKYAIAE